MHLTHPHKLVHILEKKEFVDQKQQELALLLYKLHVYYINNHQKNKTSQFSCQSHI